MPKFDILSGFYAIFHFCFLIFGVAYQVEAFTSSHDFKGLCGCQSSNFWCPRSRTSRGINGVDIKAQIDGCVAPNLSTDLSHQGIERFVPTFFSPNYPPTLVATPLRITLFVPSPKIHNNHTTSNTKRLAKKDNLMLLNNQIRGF